MISRRFWVLLAILGILFLGASSSHASISLDGADQSIAGENVSASWGQDLEEILDRNEFSEFSDIYSLAINWVITRVLEFFQTEERVNKALEVLNVLGRLSEIALWTLLAALLVLLFFYIRRQMARKTAEPEDNVVRTKIGRAEENRIEVLENLLQTALKAREYKEALRYRYHLLLWRMEEEDLLQNPQFVTLGKVYRDVLLKRALLPASRAKNLHRSLQRNFYGARSEGIDEFNELNRTMEEVEARF